MQNKSLILGITVLIALLCLYNLSFTWITRGVENKARTFATDASGNYSSDKYRDYINSIYREPVADLVVDQYTYAEAKQKELKLGLDLQGGMHVILEVDPKAVLLNLATLKKDPELNQALEMAETRSRESQQRFITLFQNAYEEVEPQGKLARLFASSSKREHIDYSSTNDEVVDYLKGEMDGAIDRSFQIIRSRVDQFGTAQPNIQRLPGSGRIQVELPGVSNPERVRKLLTSVAELEFVEVYTLQEFNQILTDLNDYLYENRNKPEIKALGKTPELPSDTSAAEEGSFLDEAPAGEEEEGFFAEEDEDSIPDNAKDDFLDESEDTLDVEEDGLDAVPDNTLTEEEDTADPLNPTEEIAEEAISDTEESIMDTAMADTLSDDTAAQDTAQKASVFYDLLQITALDREEGKYYMFGALVEDTGKVNKMFNLPGVQALLPPNFSYAWEHKPFDAGGQQMINIYFLKRQRGGRPTLAGDVVTDARQDIGPSGTPSVSMSMNVTGTKEWRRITTANVGEAVAILLDNRVYSAPNINEPIPSGRSSISGNFEIQEAKDLANVLKAGKLPAPTKIVEEAVVGPTIGEESINNGLMSMITGIILVMLFMIAYYAMGGVVANVALLVNIFFILGILAQFNTALTLPGIASIVLTIGMSVDANVLIFERIREELRNGAKMLAAIEIGYSKAYSSIIDANVTTFLTGAILFVFGTGGVKGFGITLMIGIACSLFSAVFITRLILDWVARSKYASTVKFTTGISKNTLANLKVPFMARRRIGYTFSAILIAAGIGATIVNGGLNLGVDFRGGRTFIVRFDQAVSSAEVGANLAKTFKGEGTVVKTYNRADQLKITTSYLINDDSKEASVKVKEQLMAGLKANYGDLNPEVLSTAKVGATIADDIKAKALQSMVIALALIFVYILVRFLRWQFSLGALVALFHDVLIVLSVFAIADLLGLNFEIDQVFIAAALTVVGYSINDTVVVFDRIREYSGKLTGSEIVRNMDNSINSTLSRTLITTLTTLFVVVLLLVFGGEALSGFSFALLVGVLIGTYSSMFIASPVVYDLAKPKKKVKEA